MAFKTQRTQRTPRKLDRAKVVELAEQGLKTIDIAKHQGVAPSTVFRFLQQTEPGRHALETFKKDRADAFARLSMKSLDVQDKILETFDDRLIATLQPHQKGSLLHALTIQFGVLYDKERLERGQSTGNISVLGKFILEAEAKLGSPKAAPGPTESAPAGSVNAGEDQT